MISYILFCFHLDLDTTRTLGRATPVTYTSPRPALPAEYKPIECDLRTSVYSCPQPYVRTAQFELDSRHPTRCTIFDYEDFCLTLSLLKVSFLFFVSSLSCTLRSASLWRCSTANFSKARLMILASSLSRSFCGWVANGEVNMLIHVTIAYFHPAQAVESDLCVVWFIRYVYPCPFISLLG